VLAGGRLHHIPGCNRADAPGAELLEPAHFGLDVIGFDVQVHTARVSDPLHLQVRLIGGRIESAV